MNISRSAFVFANYNFSGEINIFLPDNQIENIETVIKSIVKKSHFFFYHDKRIVCYEKIIPPGETVYKTCHYPKDSLFDKCYNMEREFPQLIKAIYKEMVERGFNVNMSGKIIIDVNDPMRNIYEKLILSTEGGKVDVTRTK